MWKMLLANFSGNHSSSESRNAAYFPVADWSAKFLAAQGSRIATRLGGKVSRNLLKLLA